MVFRGVCEKPWEGKRDWKIVWGSFRTGL